MLTLIQFGIWTTIWVMAGYTVVNILIGNFIEPNFMGKELGLSPLVVFLSLVFWGWLLGPIGMLLSVPLTMTAKIACDSRVETKWIGVLLGP
jgi:predicted PurR-regulated permease PerM